ncbi:hypothetical protein EKL30_04025 [Candidimonas sp. SYP-B2681]|uniref:anti-sigma factor family protein n=1 Tax=Candidimonas sp. SYP-B2681 TaxID=2497686 RepID=UPI000F8962D1|nr:hypothetical protein [Candidimonas sp. SYP-B2681]RTZ48132.1 hypothetical protein EKL30_04025 [Candidimonas sp. SYP-B2681]
MSDRSAFKKFDFDEAYHEALSAMADNEVSPSVRAALIQLAANDPKAAERIARYHAQNAALQALFPLRRGNTPRISIPERLPWKQRTRVAATWVAIGFLLGVVHCR